MKDDFKAFLDEYKAQSRIKDFGRIAEYLVLKEKLYDEIKKINEKIYITTEEEYKDKNETYFDLIVQYFGARMGVILQLPEESMVDLLKVLNDLIIKKTDLEIIIVVRMNDDKLFEGVIFDSLVKSDFDVDILEWAPLDTLIMSYFRIEEMKKIPMFAPIQIKYDDGFINNFKTIFRTKAEAVSESSFVEESAKENFQKLVQDKSREIDILIDEIFMNIKKKKIFERILEICGIEGSDIA